MAITDNTAKWEVKKVGAGSPAEMVGATASAKGKSGIVPEPEAGANGKFLRGDGTWQNVPTPSLSGLGLTASAAELNYVDGVTSNIQTQLNSKLSTSGTAANATQLATARTIDGVAFDGSVDITHYGVCDTAADVEEKTVTITGFTLVTGAVAKVKFTNANTATSPKLNVNSTGAKSIMYHGNVPGTTIGQYHVYEFVYDGTYWRLADGIAFKGATADDSGRLGLVPSPGSGKQNAFLRGDGTWATSIDTLTVTTTLNIPGGKIWIA
jgi:hypothetical protein